VLYFTQNQIFLFFLVIGLGIGIFYDFFRALRKNISTSDLVTQIEDIIFLVISIIIILYSIIKVSGGEVRFYIFLAIFLGILLYFLTISKPCVIILNVIVNICKKFLIKIFKIVIKPLQFIKKICIKK
jgi:spore cortex biosynthesis protein YabQ